jgi:hypothetical protein
MKILFILLSGLLLFACSPDATIHSQNIDQSKVDKSPGVSVTTSEIKKIGEFALLRNSDTRDENGWTLPPYKNAEIKMGFYFEPRIGEEITIVPLKISIEPFRIKIVNATKTKNSGCIKSETEQYFWAIETEKITKPEILEIKTVDKNYKNQMPISVFAIYPAVKFAKSLNKLSLSKNSLPRNVLFENVESAIDLNNDETPDLLSVNFCCGEPEKVKVEKCPYICKKYYKKNNKVWELFDTQDFQEIC